MGKQFCLTKCEIELCILELLTASKLSKYSSCHLGEKNSMTILLNQT